MNRQPPETDGEDEKVWQELTRNIQKLPQPEEPPSAPIYIDEITPSVSYKNIPNAHQLPPLQIGCLDQMDGSMARHFKRGDYPVEATLDLHGKTEDMAYDAVCKFIKQSYLSGKRCIMIITGKGLNADEDNILTFKGKLRERTPVWLNSDELRPLILGIIHPDARRGGTGALAIMLRKKR